MLIQLFAVRVVGTDKYLPADRCSHSWNDPKNEWSKDNPGPRLFFTHAHAKRAGEIWKRGKYSEGEAKHVPGRNAITFEVVRIALTVMPTEDGEPNDDQHECSFV